MNVLVTGSSGFIGGHLSAQFPGCIRFDLRDNPFLDIRNFGAVDTFWKETKPDVVVHLAGNPNPGISNSAPEWDAYDNIVGTINVLRASLNHAVRSFVYASTAHVYQIGSDKIPQNETTPCKPVTPYAISKYAGEMYCHYFKSKGLEITILRFFNAYGPRQALNFVVPDLIKRISSFRSANGSVRVLGPPDDSRDFVYIADLVDAITKTVNMRPTGETINIGSGVETPTRKLCESISNVLDKHVSFEYAERPPGRIAARFQADIRKAKLLIGWEPRFGLVEGLKDMMDLTINRPEENVILESA